MPLATREEVATRFLDGAEKHCEGSVSGLTADVDNLLGHSVGIDDHQRIDNALRDLFEKLAAEQDVLESVRRYRSERKL